MEHRELRSLQLLAESGSLSRTAAALNLTAAAVHKQLKQLEAELEVPLYERKDGGLCLTPAAEVLLPYLQEILGQHESALSALAEWKGVRRGVLRVGAGPSLATYLLPPVLKSYHERFPGIDFEILTGSSLQLIGLLKSGELDMALVVAPDALEEPSLRVALESQTEIVLVSRTGHGAARPSLPRLRNLPFLLFRKGARIENLIERYWAERNLAPNVIMRFDSAEALKAMLLTGVGISMLPLYTVQDDIETGRLERIRQKEAPLIMKIHLLTRGSGYVPPAVTEFIRCAKMNLIGSIV